MESAMQDLASTIRLNRTWKYSCVLALQKEDHLHVLAVDCMAIPSACT